MKTNPLFQKIEVSEVFWDFDLISQNVKEKIFQVFEKKVNSIAPKQQTPSGLNENQILTFLKKRKIEYYYEVKVAIRLIQYLDSISEEKQACLLNELQQQKGIVVNKEALDKFKSFIIECSKQDEGLQERLFIELDRNLLRIVNILGQEKLIDISVEKIDKLDELFKSAPKDIGQIYAKYRGKFIGLFCLTFSCPLITRPALIDYFLKIVRTPELIHTKPEERNKDTQLSKTVNRSLGRIKVKKKLATINDYSEISAIATRAAKSFLPSREKNNAEASEMLKSQVDPERFTNRYLLPNTWISNVMEDANTNYGETYSITTEIHEIFKQFEKGNLTYQNLTKQQQQTIQEIHQRKGKTFKELLAFFEHMGEKEPERFMPDDRAEGIQISNGLTILGLQKKPYRDKEGIHVKFGRFS